jgi:uncharacterized protein YacL
MRSDFIARIIGMLALGGWGLKFGNELSVFTDEFIPLQILVFTLSGAALGFIATPYLTTRPIDSLRRKIGSISAQSLFSGIIGLIVSLLISGLLSFPLSLLPEPYSQVLPLSIAIFICYIGTNVFIMRKNDIFSATRSLLAYNSGNAGSNSERAILTDTSVIIDGRVVDIAKTGFMPGKLLIPKFVLAELQYIADSEDALRRQRGRRGLEVLSKLQKDSTISVEITDIDVEGTRAVDDKLVILARQMNVPILTNDFNLNKVAELQGVSILNINELANSIKAVFLPGEKLTVRVIQEGREENQGIGYLEDGTMVVIQDGTDYIGVELSTVVTKVLQTAAGRMIFSKPE